MSLKDFKRHYAYTSNQDLIWGDMDAFKHLNNVAYFRLFETIRISYFKTLGVLNMMKKSGIGPILHSTNCRYRIPLTFPDTLTLGIRVTKIESDRYHLDHGVYSKQHSGLAANGDACIVCFDYKSNKKSSVPSALIERVLKFQEDCPPII